MKLLTRHRIVAYAFIVLVSYATPTRVVNNQLTGDADLYGIGVRLSFYLQYGAAFIAKLMDLHDELKLLRRTMNVVALAVLVNAIISTVHGSFAVLEWYIVFNIAIVLPLPWFMPSFEVSTEDGKQAIEATNPTKNNAINFGLYLMLHSVVSAMQPWLYFGLLHQGYREGCLVRIFVYAPFSIYNPHWVAFGKTVSILGCLGILISLPLSLWTIVYGLRAGWNGGSPIGNIRRTGTLATVIKALFLGLLGISSIIFTEKTIQLNNIDLSGSPLTSASQLIPFLVGLFSLSAVPWAGLKAMRSGIGKEQAQC
ncbi:hypothetical protein B0A49_01265 [Cryomyces minteri]|uniref:Uncharacterized protein n=1 Tax=Cryomyces minteri TaxID=331657 RepID=A0A4U0XY73_9PEZI|nr:hypothetical protein B0A49_01265 [Cryomyces minteri]